MPGGKRFPGPGPRNSSTDSGGNASPCRGVAVSDGVVAGEDRAPAIEVMPARRDALAGKTEQFPVELGRALDVPDGQDHPVEPKSHFVSWNRRIPPQSSSPLPVSLYRLE